LHLFDAFDFDLERGIVKAVVDARPVDPMTGVVLWLGVNFVKRTGIDANRSERAHDFFNRAATAYAQSSASRIFECESDTDLL
jgi:hypothetical protein